MAKRKTWAQLARKWGKIGAPGSEKRRAWMKLIRKKK